MIYNATWRRKNFIEGPTQDQIYRMPEYFARSREEVFADPRCPDFLKRILDQFPWDGRKSLLQIRPQDFRTRVPEALGSNWHTDIMVRLHDGNVRVARDSKEMHLMVCSWGDVVETEFLGNPMEMRDIFDGQKPEFSPMDLLNTVHRTPLKIESARPGELIEYTSADIHRMGDRPRLGRLRLMIVAFDSDTIEAGGIELPSIEERERGLGPKFSDYVR